jgi:hypothetical protein
MLRVEPFLCNDREIGGYTRAVSRQRLGKYVPTTSNRRATIEVLLETGFSTRSVPRSDKEDNWGRSSQFCMGVCEERT